MPQKVTIIRKDMKDQFENICTMASIFPLKLQQKGYPHHSKNTRHPERH
jgi:hypothetical protein